MLKLDSLYIHRRGFTSIINQCYLPPKARRHAAPTRWATPPCQRPSPPCCGDIPRNKGGCGVRGPKRSTVARAVASRHGVNENARRPNLKPMRKPRPGSEPCATPSTWRSSRHSGATSGAQGSAEQLPGGPKPVNLPTHAAVPYPPHRTADRSYGGPRLSTDSVYRASW